MNTTLYILWRFGTAGMICPQCRSADCYRSRRSGLTDLFAATVGLKPWRCHTCDYRFRGGRVASAFRRYAHCPRCGNFDLDPISSERVDRDPLRFFKRMLGFAAYRCDLCRERFFTLRPRRKIVPSLIPTAPGEGPQRTQG